jgi:P27 family predicted phage terminase small subunit
MPYPRTPSSVKRLRGNPGRRPLREDVDAGVLERLPNPPAWLDDEARKFYRLAGRECIKMAVLARVDVAALVTMSAMWGRWVNAERHLCAEGEVVRAPNGSLVLNPWLTVSNRALDRFCALASKFGGNPADRTRLTLKESGPDLLDLRALLFGEPGTRVEVIDVTPAQLPVPADNAADLADWLREDGE